MLKCRLMIYQKEESHIATNKRRFRILRLLHLKISSNFCPNVRTQINSRKIQTNLIINKKAVPLGTAFLLNKSIENKSY